MRFKIALLSIPTHYMSLFHALTSDSEKLEKIPRLFFFWDAADRARKFHLLKWETITSPKIWGGLDHNGLKVFNKALLDKWLWRFRVEVSALWRRVIVDKYEAMVGEWGSRDVTMPLVAVFGGIS